VTSSKNSKVEKKVSSYENFIERLNFGYFGLISMTILVGSIFGGIAVSFILSNHAPTWELCLCVGAAMANNSAGIGQAPTIWVFNLFILSTVVNILLIVVNI
jgi:hypothetical protein